jgi:hypothetical protein
MTLAVETISNCCGENIRHNLVLPYDPVHNFPLTPSHEVVTEQKYQTGEGEDCDHDQRNNLLLLEYENRFQFFGRVQYHL